MTEQEHHADCVATVTRVFDQSNGQLCTVTPHRLISGSDSPRSFICAQHAVDWIDAHIPGQSVRWSITQEGELDKRYRCEHGDSHYYGCAECAQIIAEHDAQISQKGGDSPDTTRPDTAPGNSNADAAVSVEPVTAAPTSDPEARPTPRTDDEEWKTYDRPVVDSDFARTLERELADEMSRSELAERRLAEEIQHSSGAARRSYALQDKLAVALAQVEKLRKERNFAAECNDAQAQEIARLKEETHTDRQAIEIGKYAIETLEAERDAALSKLAEAQAHLDRIDAGVRCDAEDLEKMRDGTKLTRSGLVEIIMEQNERLAAARKANP